MLAAKIIEWSLIEIIQNLHSNALDGCSENITLAMDVVDFLAFLNILLFASAGMEHLIYSICYGNCEFLNTCEYEISDYRSNQLVRKIPGGLDSMLVDILDTVMVEILDSLMV